MFNLSFGYSDSEEIKNICHLKDNIFIVSSDEHHCILDVGKGHFENDQERISIQDIILNMVVHSSG